MPPIDMESDPLRAALWHRGEAVSVDDVPSSTVLPDAWKARWGSRSLAFAPLRAADETYGLLAVDYVRAAHAFTEEERQLLDAISCAVGAALRGANLLQRLQNTVEIERRLSECTTAVQSGRSLDEVLRLIADGFASLLPGVGCEIYLFDHEGAARTVASHGDGPLPGVIEPEIVSRLRELWLRDPHTPVLLPGTDASARWSLFSAGPVENGVLIALHEGTSVLGFIAGHRASGKILEDEVHVGLAFAHQVALVVAHARLNDTLRARLLATETLQRLSDVVLRTSDLRGLLASLNRGICREIGIRCLGVTFADRALATMLGVNAADKEDLAFIRMSRASQVTTLRPATGEGIRVPIRMGGRIAGVLHVRGLRDVSPTGVEFILAIAAGLGEVAYKAKLRRTGERRMIDLVVANERERIARDLHDTIGQTLFGIGLHLQDLIYDVDDPDLASRLSKVRSLASQGSSDVRSAVFALAFLHVRSKGLLPSLRMLARQFTDATGVGVEVRLQGKLPPMAEETTSALYRLAHEAMVNVDRHARATGVVMTVIAREGEVELAIRDDGVGMDQRQVKEWRSAAHFGMRSMAKAMASVGGRFTVVAADPRGLMISGIVSVKRGRPAKR